jgi:hypothetical protein
MFNAKYSCHICLIFVLRVACILGVVLNVNPSTYVEHPTFCISECLAAFNVVISSCFLVSFDEVLKTVTQQRCKLQ